MVLVLVWKMRKKPVEVINDKVTRASRCLAPFTWGPRALSHRVVPLQGDRWVGEAPLVLLNHPWK